MNLSSKFSLFAVLILLISTGCTDNPYKGEDAENQIASYGVLVHPMTNNHSAAPGYDTDFILTVLDFKKDIIIFDKKTSYLFVLFYSVMLSGSIIMRTYFI